MGFTTITPIQINRKLLHATFPSSLNFEHPRCSTELIDRKMEDPIINTNLKKKPYYYTVDFFVYTPLIVYSLLKEK